MSNSIKVNHIKNDVSQINSEYQIYFIFVVFLISLQLICNTIEPIIFQSGILKIPTSAMFYVLTFAICDVITENFGFKLAVRATVLNIISQFIYCGIALIVLLIPKEFLTEQAAHSFQFVFHFISLELISSIVSLFIAMVINDYLINKLKYVFLGQGFWWRTIVSTVIGELVMLNIDYNITFIGSKGFLDIQQLILSAMIYKVIAAILLSLPSAALSNFIQKKVFYLKPEMNYKVDLFGDLKNAIIFR